MGDDVLAFDRVVANQLRNGRGAGLLPIDKLAQPFALKKGDAPAIGVVAGVARALAEARKTKAHIGGRVAIHSKQLAHSF